MCYLHRGKRGLDIGLALLLIAFLLPLLILVSLLLFISQGRPVLFSQVRMGLHFKPFTLLKFRTMEVTDRVQQSTFSPGAVDRRTGIGRWMRKSKLDELPQLWNVVRGDMSLVGPRPEVPEWTNPNSASWIKTLSVKPGLTDYASIAFVDEESILNKAFDPIAKYKSDILPRKLDLACTYVDTLSFKTDVAIMFKTLLRMVVR